MATRAGGTSTATEPRNLSCPAHPNAYPWQTKAPCLLHMLLYPHTCIHLPLCCGLAAETILLRDCFLFGRVILSSLTSALAAASSCIHVSSLLLNTAGSSGPSATRAAPAARHGTAQHGVRQHSTFVVAVGCLPLHQQTVYPTQLEPSQPYSCGRCAPHPTNHPPLR